MKAIMHLAATACLLLGTTTSSCSGFANHNNKQGGSRGLAQKVAAAARPERSSPANGAVKESPRRGGERQKKTRLDFQQRLFAARVRYGVDEKRASLRRNLVQVRTSTDGPRTKKRMEDRNAAVLREALSASGGLAALDQGLESLAQGLVESHIHNDYVAAKQRRMERRRKVELQQQLLVEDGIEYDRSDNSKVDRAPLPASASHVKEEASLASEEKEDIQSGDNSRNILFRRRLLEAQLQNKVAEKQNGIEKKNTEFQRRLLEAMIGYGRTSNLKDGGESLTLPQVEDDHQPGDSARTLFQQKLLEAQLRMKSAAKKRVVEKQKLEFQRRLLEARIGYDRTTTLPAQVLEEDVETQTQQRFVQHPRDTKLAVTDKYLATIQGSAAKLSISLTSEYLDAIQAVASRGEIAGLTGHYLAALQVGAKSGDAQADIRLAAETENQRQTEGSTGPLSAEAVDRSTPAPEKAASLVGRTLLDQFNVVYKLDDTVSDKCDLYIAHHVTDDAKQYPLIVKLASADYYGPIESITLEYSIYQDLFSRLPTEAEQRLFVRPYDWIEPSPETDGKAGFVMECGSANLRELIWRNGACTGVKLRRQMENMIRVVEALHNLGAVWTDLKTANFIVFANGDIKAIDLESIAAHGETARMYSSETYPPEFPADLLYQGLPDIPVDYSYDVWGLGMSLFEMATGEPFYTREMMYDIEYIKARLRDPRGIASEIYAKLSHVDEGARNVILQCLAIDPRMRRSCKDLLSDPYFIVGRQDDATSDTQS